MKTFDTINELFAAALNLLKNGDFNGDWWRKTHTGQEYGEIFVPVEWTAYWLEDSNFSRPEMHVINFEEPFIDPPRVCELPRAVKWFSFFRNHQAGIYQTVTGLHPGARYRLSVRAHAWYSQRDDAHLSEYQDSFGDWHEIQDGDPGMKFYLWVDVEGRSDPWITIPDENESTANIYNAFGEIVLEFTATGDTVTVFIESATLYPFKHCDAYVDDARLEMIDAPPEPPVCPPVDYVVVAELMHQTMPLEDVKRVAERAYTDRRTFLFSEDDAVRLVIPGQPGSKVDVWEPQLWTGGDIVKWLYAAGVPRVDTFYLDDPEPPDPPDPPPIDPPPATSFVPTGIVASWGTIGGQGQEDLFEYLAPLGAAPPTAKFVQDVGAASIVTQHAPSTIIVGRMIDVMYNGQRYNVEGFDYSGDPERQAEARMELLRETMTDNPAVDVWEIVNEILPPHPQDIVAISRFFIRAMQIAYGLGRRLALFSFSTGTPEPEAWGFAASTGVFGAANVGGHALSLHEYGLWPRDAVSHLLRFKFLYDNIILPRGLHIPLYVTEYGVPRGDFDTVDKMQQICAYDAQLARLWYVAGAHIYVNPWDSDYSKYVDLYPEYQQYAIAIKDRING